MIKACPIEYCSYPIGECQGLCSTREEQRQDVIGQNGNDGLANEVTPMKFETRMETVLFQLSHSTTHAFKALQNNHLMHLQKHLQDIDEHLASANNLLFSELHRRENITKL